MKQLNVTVVGSHIFVTGTEFANRGTWRRIPASRWNKVRKHWRYPASPFSAFRIKYFAEKLGHTIKHDSEFKRLLYDMLHIRELEHNCKKPEAIELAEKTKETAFDTVTIPWAHQVLASDFSKKRNSVYLAMDMGTGKTMVGINEFHCSMDNFVLIVCPLQVVDVWIDELEKHMPNNNRRVLVLDQGSSSKRADQFNLFTYHRLKKGPTVVIVNYESLWRGNLGAAFLDADFDVIVYDEIHKLKAAGSRVSRFAARLWRSDRFLIGLSGTPFPSGSKIDLYGQYRALDPGVFGPSKSKFQNRYFEVEMETRWDKKKQEVVEYPVLVGSRNDEELDRLLGLTMFRVEKSDVMDLPESISVGRYFRLDDNEREIYDEIQDELVAYVKSGTVTALNALSKAIRLQQITSGFVKTEEGVEERIGYSKANLLRKILSQEIPEGEPVCVFCKYTKDLATVKRITESLELRYKEVSGKRKDLERSKYPSNCDVLGLQVQSGGLGVQLQKSAYCIFYSIGRSLGEHIQCKDRLHRGGQTRQVMYIYLIAKDSIDEVIKDAIDAKKEFTDAIYEKIRQIIQ